MRKTRRYLLLALSLSTIVTTGAILPVRAEAPPAMVTSFAPIVERVAPSVVTIYSSKTVRRQPSPFDDPTFRRFFGVPDDGTNGVRPYKEKQQGLGSGVVVSADGFILTNNHVVEGADEILVSLGAGSKEYKAKKVGTDPRTDIAVLKIDTKDLKPVSFGDSSKLRVGDVVLAVGNPFGLGQSVSMGIVSAVKRSGMHITAYEDFIQTDAAINMGNSGGALVDAQGNLIGINTAIYSRTGGNQGIGFAVPANMAKTVMEKIREKGRVVRGYVGVMLQSLTPDLVEAFQLKDTTGALVADVSAGSPAEKAGIKVRDIITALNGQKVTDSRDLQFKVSAMDPGNTVELAIMRDGKEQKVSVTLEELPDEKGKTSDAGQTEDVPNVLDGVSVGDINAEARSKFEIGKDVQGALVTGVDPDSVGAKAGLQVGDVVQEINRQPVKNADEAIAISRAIKEKDKVLLRVFSRGGSRFLVLDEEE